MKNYHYIIASLPDIAAGWKSGDHTADDIISDIKERCDRNDAALVDFLCRSFEADSLTEEFYREASKSKNPFIKEYFDFDLNIRNAKVRYLNRELSRPEGKDEISLATEDGNPLEKEFEQAEAIARVLQDKDIIAREKAIDDLYWEKLDELSLMHYFDMDVIMAFILKLHIVDRWNILDEQTGREMFRRLVDEVRGSYKGVEYEI